MKRILTIACLFAMVGCYNDKADKLYPAGSGGGCDTTTVTFQAHILPIMNQNCALSGCHDATASSGYNLSSYAGVKLAVDNKRLIGTIRHETNYQPMPKNMPKLDSCSIHKIVRWANLGAMNN